MFNLFGRLSRMLFTTDSSALKFDPDQPRHPPGSPEGGRWLDTGMSIVVDPHGAPAPAGTVENKGTHAEAVVGENGIANFKQSFGLKRAEMPQVPSADFPDFVAWTKKERGVDVEKGKKHLGGLRPVQKEYNTRLSSQLPEATVVNHPLTVSEDDYVLDGHNRFVRLLQLKGTEHEAHVNRIKLPVKEALDLMQDYPGVLRSSVEHVGKTIRRKLARLFKAWNEDQHPRDPAGGPSGGQFTSGGGGYEFYSPNEEDSFDFAGALKHFNDARHQAFMAHAEKIDSLLGVEVTNHLAALGDTKEWGTEESVYMRTSPDTSFEMLQVSAAMKGWLANQKGVIAFKPGDGEQAMYEMEIPADRASTDAIRTALDEAGLEFRMLVPGKDSTRVVIFDQKQGSLIPNMERIASKFERGYIGVSGQGQTIEGDGSREGARRVYEGIIEQQVGASGVRDAWAWIRDHRSYEQAAQKGEVIRRKYSPDQPRGVTTPGTTPGSFAPGSSGGGTDKPPAGNKEQFKDAMYAREGIADLGYQQMVDKLGNDRVNELFDEVRTKEKAWQSQMIMALSMGTISMQDARKQGLYATDFNVDRDWLKLPPEMFHVTTNTTAVLKDGLKTRDELGQMSGLGLGGGTSNTVSFTNDRNIAQGIYDGMHFVHDVMNDKITLQDLVNQATSGENASRPFLSDIAESWGAVNSKGVPVQWAAAIDGRKVEAITPMQGRDENGKYLWPEKTPVDADPKTVAAKLGKDWQHVEDAKYKYFFTRPATEKELDDVKMETAKKFMFMRESAGGPLDPLFFLSDAGAFKRTPKAEINILKTTQKPNTYGYKVSALGEIRTYTGKVVDSIDVLKTKARVIKFDPDQPRAPAGVSEGGQWTGADDGKSSPGTGKGTVQDGERVSGSTGRVASPGRADLADDEPLEGLPRKIKVPGVGEVTAGPDPRVRAAARAYMKAAGMDYDPPATYAKVDVERAQRIAKAFDDMAHDPQDKETKAAYSAMITEVVAQYQVALDTGLKVEFIDFAKNGDPYAASPRLMTEDVRNNNHMWVFSTADGFGSSAMDVSDNPLLAPTKFKISGQTATANDMFRVVHDYFGHVKEGVGFRADGEENAWRSHSAMFSPLARRAMTTETRGQNSWVNYGPHGEDNRTAKSGTTVFADQKIGLLPKWVTDEAVKVERKKQFDPDQPRDEDGKWTDTGASSTGTKAIVASMSEFAKKSKDTLKERIVIVDHASGTVLADYEQELELNMQTWTHDPKAGSGFSHADMFDEKGEARPDMSIQHFHTHPIDETFSDGDWKIFTRTPIADMQVVTADNVYRLEKTDAFNNLPWQKRTPAEIAKTYEKILNEVFDTYTDKPGESISESTHAMVQEATVRMAEHYKVKYTITPIKQAVKLEHVQKLAFDWEKRILEAFVSFRDEGDQMMQTISALHTSRVSAYGFTAEAEATGVTKYEISAQLDNRVCPVCEEMDGQEFEVEDARASLDQILHVSDPEDLRTLQPWPSQSAHDVSEMALMTPDELVDRNWHVPPYHPDCRCLLVPVDSADSFDVTRTPSFIAAFGDDDNLLPLR